MISYASGVGAGERSPSKTLFPEKKKKLAADIETAVAELNAACKAKVDALA